MKTLNFRMPVISAKSMIAEGIATFHDDRRYYEGRPQSNFKGVYKIIILPSCTYTKEGMEMWGEHGENIFRISRATGYEFNAVWSREAGEHIPVSKWDDVEDVYDMNQAVTHIKGVMKKSKARSYAREIGLTYWPGLIDWRPGCDAYCMVAAERVLERKHGVWGTKDAEGVKNSGGFDSYGHHGVSASDVRAYWFAAGCKDSAKFHAQVRTRMKALKSESVNEFMNFVRGSRWVEARREKFRYVNFSRKAIAAIGRLSNNLRNAVVHGLGDRPSDAVVRIRHLNWESAASVQKAINAHEVPELAHAVACLSFGINSDAELGVYGEKECLARLDALFSGGPFGFFNADSSAIKRMLEKKKYVELMHRLYIANLDGVVSIPISRGLVTHSVESRITPFSSEWEKVSLGDVSNDIAQMLSVIFTWRNNAALMKLLMLEADQLSTVMVASELITGEHNYANFAIPLIVVEEALKHPLLGFSCMEVIESEHGVRECVENKSSDLYKQVKAFVDMGHIRKAAALPGIPPIYGLSLSLGKKIDLFSMSHPCSYKSFNLKAINAILSKDKNVFASDLLNLSNALGMEAIKCLDTDIAHADADFGDNEDTPIPVDHSPFHIFANNVRMPSVYNALSQQWNQFFSKNKDCLMYAGHVHSEMAIPKSKEAFVAEMAKYRYKNGPRASDALLEFAGRVSMSQDTFDLYLEAVEEITPKPYEMLPFVRIDGSKYESIGHEYVLEKLDYNDPTMLGVGLETACCQHLEGVGSSPAEHSYTHPSSAVYVLRKNGAIVAQSWVWRNETDGVVFDSIEGRRSMSGSVVAAAFMELAKQLIGKLCIKAVYVGATSYGFTTEFVNRNGVDDASITHTEMIEPCSYMDGRYHYLVVG